MFFFFSSRRRHTRFDCDWSSDVCSSDLYSGEVSLLVPGAGSSPVLVHAAADTTGAHMSWWLGREFAGNATLERHDGASPWADLARLVPDAEGYEIGRAHV